MRITAKFPSADFADFALGKLQKQMMIKNPVIKPHKSDSELPVMYPIKPEYLDVSHTQYLEGMPHILSGSPIYNDEMETDSRDECSLSFETDSTNASKVQNIILRFSGYEYKQM